MKGLHVNKDIAWGNEWDGRLLGRWTGDERDRMSTRIMHGGDEWDGKTTGTLDGRMKGMGC